VPQALYEYSTVSYLLVLLSIPNAVLYSYSNCTRRTYIYIDCLLYSNCTRRTFINIHRMSQPGRHNGMQQLNNLIIANCRRGGAHVFVWASYACTVLVLLLLYYSSTTVASRVATLPVATTSTVVHLEKLLASTVLDYLPS
jgi:hypothetical protein